MNKLSPLTYYIIGGAIFVIAFSYGFFNQYLPNTAEAKSFTDTAQDLEQEAAKQPQAKARVKQAEKMVNDEAEKWNKLVATRTPASSLNEGGINLNENAWQLSVDTHKYVNNIQRAVNAQVRHGGITVLNGPNVHPFEPGYNTGANSILASFYNYPAIKFPVVIFDFGTITVQGTYDQIKENIQGWAKMPRYLAVTDGLALSGTSPNLVGTYNVSMVGFIRGKKIYPSVPEAEAASTSGFGGAGMGARGGSPFGGPGGPPGGFGGPGGGPGGPGRPMGMPPGMGGAPMGAPGSPRGGGKGADN